jgi:hypothetical protein
VDKVLVVAFVSSMLKWKRHVDLLQDLAAAVVEVDADKFTDVVKEFDSMSRLVSLVYMMSSVGCGYQLCEVLCKINPGS